MISPGALLRAAPLDEPIETGSHLRGFGGVHGRLALALLTTAMAERAPATLLQRVTARYLRPLGDEFRIEVSTERSGRTMTALATRAMTQKDVHVDATAIFATPQPASWPTAAPPAPAAPPPEQCEVFTIPPGFVPISTSMEIRPVGPNRPYTGGAEPELTAWIRLLEDDEPELVLLPTVEFAVRPVAAGLKRAASPWVLLRARTHQAGADGWVDEGIDAWGPDGDHLGSARQTRLVRPA